MFERRNRRFFAIFLSFCSKLLILPNAMAEPCIYYSICWNFSPTCEDKLAEVIPRAPTDGNKTLTSIPNVLYSPTFAFAVAPTATPYSDIELFKPFIKASIEAQVPALTALKVDLALFEQPRKAQFLDLYYRSLHMNCYRFCQLCEDHFKTAGAKKPNRNLFAALFLHGLVT